MWCKVVQFHMQMRSNFLLDPWYSLQRGIGRHTWVLCRLFQPFFTQAVMCASRIKNPECSDEDIVSAYYVISIHSSLSEYTLKLSSIKNKAVKRQYYCMRSLEHHWQHTEVSMKHLYKKHKSLSLSVEAIYTMYQLHVYAFYIWPYVCPMYTH